MTNGAMNARRVRLKATRRGAIAVLAAILMVVMVGMMAFSIDLGFMYAMQTELQRSVDAAALAGAGTLVEGEATAKSTAVEYLVRNPVGDPNGYTTLSSIEAAKIAFMTKYEAELSFTAGDWNPVTKQVEATQYPSSYTVSRTYQNIPLFFAPILGKDNFSITAQATATFQPRDIVLVLDYSASMNDDSTFSAYSTLGQTTVDANLLECYQDLNSPSYGSLQFEPKYATIAGVAPTNATKPQIYVEYRYNSVYVTSTLNLENVVLKFSNNQTKTFSGLTAKTGTFQGTGSNATRQITQIWVKSGNNLSGQGPSYGEPFDFRSNVIVSKLKTAFGLNTVTYPYASGSWDDFINYCISTSEANYTAGYHYKLGFKNLLVYWLDKKPAFNQTADLWKISAQPVTALKDAVDVFVDVLDDVPAGDKLGLSIYDYTDGNAVIESSLSSSFSTVANIVRQRQAGHYHSYTNIGAGLQKAREHLDSSGRTNAAKMIILMTDGNANWNNGQYNITAAENHVLSEAALCADASRRYPILTISFGSGADTSIMEQVANITDGTHFNVPGGQSVAQKQQELEDVFEAIAKFRPLRLVQ